MSRRRSYPSDLTDDQWAIIEALLPPPRRGGRPEKHSRRAIVDVILYLVRPGCSWRQLPADFPPWQRRVLVLRGVGGGEGDRRDARRGAR